MTAAVGTEPQNVTNNQVDCSNRKLINGPQDNNSSLMFDLDRDPKDLNKSNIDALN